jgi:hypothetical protein
VAVVTSTFVESLLIQVRRVWGLPGCHLSKTAFLVDEYAAAAAE